MTMELIRQGVGGLVVENWALQQEVTRLQQLVNATASRKSKGKPQAASEPSAEGKSAGADQPAPPVPPKSSGG